MGGALARLWHDAGHNVVLTYTRDPERLGKLARALGANAGSLQLGKTNAGNGNNASNSNGTNNAPGNNAVTSLAAAPLSVPCRPRGPASSCRPARCCRARPR